MGAWFHDTTPSARIGNRVALECSGREGNSVKATRTLAGETPPAPAELQDGNKMGIRRWTMDFKIDPTPAPRQSQRDKFKPSPRVRRYRAFRDFLFFQSRQTRPPVEKIITVSILFLCPMPKSWSAKKKLAMRGKPHRQKPDIDNLVKAVIDSIYPEDDAAVPGIVARKRWKDGLGEVRVHITWEEKNA